MSRKLALETSNLTKRYASGVIAVKALDLSVFQGEIYGFLGPNGAGKTTTLKMLLGLVKPTSGSVRILGEEPGTSSGLARVGALIEAPAFYPYLSGKDNLKALSLSSRMERTSKHRIEDVLTQVGLWRRAADKFKVYSMGMKQRLGIAAALLEDPDLLILDEPTNGLDPEGVAEMRDFIRALGREKTVLLSSHTLSEIEQISDRVGIIQHGRLLTEGTVSELTGESKLLIRAEPVEEALRIAARLKEVREVEAVDGILKIDADPDQASRINRKLVSAGLEVSELGSSRQSLEEAFLRITREGADEG